MQTKNILLFNPVGKNAKVSVYFNDSTFWFTQKAMAELFGVTIQRNQNIPGSFIS